MAYYQCVTLALGGKFRGRCACDWGTRTFNTAEEAFRALDAHSDKAHGGSRYEGGLVADGPRSFPH